MNEWHRRRAMIVLRSINGRSLESTFAIADARFEIGEKSLLRQGLLERNVVVCVLQRPLIIDEPMIAGRITVDIAVCPGGEPGRRGTDSVATAGGRHHHITGSRGARCPVEPADRSPNSGADVDTILIPEGIAGRTRWHPADLAEI